MKKSEVINVSSKLSSIKWRLEKRTGFVEIERKGRAFVINARTNFDDGDERFVFVAEEGKGITLVSIEETFMYHDSKIEEFNSLCPVGTSEFTKCMDSLRAIKEMTEPYIGRVMHGSGVKEFFEVFDGK